MRNGLSQVLRGSRMVRTAGDQRDSQERQPRSDDRGGLATFLRDLAAGDCAVTAPLTRKVAADSPPQPAPAATSAPKLPMPGPMALPGSGQSTPAIRAPRAQNQWAQSVPQTQQMRATQQKANPAAFATSPKPGYGAAAYESFVGGPLRWTRDAWRNNAPGILGGGGGMTPEEVKARIEAPQGLGGRIAEDLGALVTGKPKPVVKPPAGPAELAKNPNLRYQAKLEHFTTLPEELLRKFRRGDMLAPAEEELVSREVIGHNPSLGKLSDKEFAEAAYRHADTLLNNYDTARRAWDQPDAAGLNVDPAAIPGFVDYANSI